MVARSEELTFEASKSSGEVSARLDMPTSARAIFVFAHGAGANMRHAFMEAMAGRLVERGIGTLRYQFPYMQRGTRRPDPQPILLATVRSAVERAAQEGLPLIAGGKSMGGRMTSLAAAASPLAGVTGLAFLGFPLHPAGRPGTDRADHLQKVTVPMLFMQGTRDSLAGLDLLQPVIDGLGARATLHIVDGADHGFHVLRRSGRDDASVLDELADTLSSWFDDLAGR